MTVLYNKSTRICDKRKRRSYATACFKHRDIPEAGIQIPGGTVEEGETLEAAILREVQEETGLRHLCIERFLADYIIHVKRKRNIKNAISST